MHILRSPPIPPPPPSPDTRRAPIVVSHIPLVWTKGHKLLFLYTRVFLKTLYMYANTDLHSVQFLSCLICCANIFTPLINIFCTPQARNGLAVSPFSKCRDEATGIIKLSGTVTLHENTNDSRLKFKF